MLDLSPGNGDLFILKGLLNETRYGFRITKSILIQVLIIDFFNSQKSAAVQSDYFNEEPMYYQILKTKWFFLFSKTLELHTQVEIKEMKVVRKNHIINKIRK